MERSPLRLRKTCCDWYQSWYQVCYHGPMPALNIQFTDAEIARLRERAEREGRSMRTMAHDTIVNCADRSDKDARVAEAVTRVIHLSQDLLRRLADR